MNCMNLILPVFAFSFLYINPAATRKPITIAETVLSFDADATREMWTALAAHNAVALKRALVDKKANVNVRNNRLSVSPTTGTMRSISHYSPLGFAVDCVDYYPELTTLLLDNRANPAAPITNGGKDLPIHHAVQAHHEFGAVKDLLDKAPLTIDTRGASGHTPIVRSIDKYKVPAFVTLLHRGASLNTRDNFGWSVFDHASDKPIIKVILVDYITKRRKMIDESDRRRKPEANYLIAEYDGLESLPPLT